MQWQIKDRTLHLKNRSHLMGILNSTPDSFTDGGEFTNLDAAIRHARHMIAEGATIIDVGGESTRPGAERISSEIEIERTIPLITALRSEWDGFISIDTQKSSVASAALNAGADIINDVSGLTADPLMLQTCVNSSCGIVIMHMQGSPSIMQDAPAYLNVCQEIQDFFVERLNTLHLAGIHPQRICFDPGIGFGKTLHHNLEILRNLSTLAPPGRPLLLGISRKSLLKKLTKSESIVDLDEVTSQLTALTYQAGILLHRVHNVQKCRQALALAEVLNQPNSTDCPAISTS